jgi:Cu/Ag efflux protein CusF
MYSTSIARRRNALSTLATILLVIGSAQALAHPLGQSSTDRPKYFCGKGEVISVDEDKGGVTIRHQRIEGFMEAMTMHFKTDDAEVAQGIKPGDSVRFTLKDTSDKTRLIYVEKIEPPNHNKRRA